MDATKMRSVGSASSLVKRASVSGKVSMTVDIIYRLGGWGKGSTLIRRRGGEVALWFLLVPVGAAGAGVHPVVAAAEQRAQVHAQLLDRRAAQKPPAVIDLEDRAVVVEHERVWDVDVAVPLVRRIDHLELVQQRAVFVYQEGPRRAERVAVLDAVQPVADEHRDQAAVVDEQ